MGLSDIIEKMEVKHFLYLIMTFLTLLMVGYIGKYNFMPALEAPEAILGTLTIFHNIIIGAGYVFLGLFTFILIYMLELA